MGNCLQCFGKKQSAGYQSGGKAFSGVSGGGGGGGSYEQADREAMRLAAEKRAADNQLRGVQGSKPGLTKSPEKPTGGGRGETDFMDKGTWN